MCETNGIGPNPSSFERYFVNESSDEWRHCLELQLTTDTSNILFETLYNFSESLVTAIYV